MKCFIYQIKNNLTNQVYIGQTTNFSRRKQEHLYKLKNNCHPNPKLQASWNKYGEKNFSFDKKEYDVPKEELDKLEIAEIKRNDAFGFGFNLTPGGTGGNTRGKIPFQDYCEIYIGNTRHQGLTNITAKYYNCDSSTVSAICKGKSYEPFLKAFSHLSEEEQEQYYISFKEKINFNQIQIKTKKEKLTDDMAITFLCVITSYGRGAEAAFLRKNNLSKGLKFHMSKGEYKSAQLKYNSLSDEEIFSIGKQYFSNNNLQQYSSRTIKENTSIIRPSWIAH